MPHALNKVFQQQILPIYIALGLDCVSIVGKLWVRRQETRASLLQSRGNCRRNIPALTLHHRSKLIPLPKHIYPPPPLQQTKPQTHGNLHWHMHVLAALAVSTPLSPPQTPSLRLWNNLIVCLPHVLRQSETPIAAVPSHHGHQTKKKKQKRTGVWKRDKIV